jgi:hypothetical protein
MLTIDNKNKELNKKVLRDGLDAQVFIEIIEEQRQQIEELKNQKIALIEFNAQLTKEISTKDMPKGYNNLVNENFWDLI